MHAEVCIYIRSMCIQDAFHAHTHRRAPPLNRHNPPIIIIIIIYVLPRWPRHPVPACHTTKLFHLLALLSPQPTAVQHKATQNGPGVNPPPPCPPPPPPPPSPPPPQPRLKSRFKANRSTKHIYFAKQTSHQPPTTPRHPHARSAQHSLIRNCCCLLLLVPGWPRRCSNAAPPSTRGSSSGPPPPRRPPPAPPR